MQTAEHPWLYFTWQVNNPSNSDDGKEFQLYGKTVIFPHYYLNRTVFSKKTHMINLMGSMRASHNASLPAVVYIPEGRWYFRLNAMTIFALYREN